MRSSGQGERISVVIPHFNQPEPLARCLASLRAGQRQPDEIIVVDNGSASAPAEVCARFPGVKLLAEPTPGPGPARNTGIAAATGGILAFIDADCLADTGWLAAAGAAMAEPANTILGGDVRIAYRDPARMTPLEAYESIYAFRMDRYIAREGFTGTGNLVVRRDVLADVGPFAGIGVAEDRDWGRRATHKGYRIQYVPEMKVYHPARNSVAELTRKWDRQIAHDYRDRAKGLAGKARWLLKAAALPVSPLLEVPRIAGSGRVSGVGNRLRAFGCLVVIRWYRSLSMIRAMARGRSAGHGDWTR